MNITNRTESLKHLEQMLHQSEEQEAFACRYMPTGELEDEIERVAALVYDREKARVPENLRGVCFVCEEIALYTHPGYVPPVLGKLVRTGRHRRIDLVWATQRPAECSKTITGQTDLWVLSQLTEPRDLSAIADRCCESESGSFHTPEGSVREIKQVYPIVARKRGWDAGQLDVMPDIYDDLRTPIPGAQVAS